MDDYYGKLGCCFACVECGDCDIPCFNCKCRKCLWYDKMRGRCIYFEWKREKMIWCDILIERETEKAILVNDMSKKVWLPKSQVTVYKDDHIINDYIEAGVYNVGIPRWLEEGSGLMTEGYDELEELTIEEYEKDVDYECYDTRQD